MSSGNDGITSLLAGANLQRTGKSDYLISDDLKSKRERNWPIIPTKCDIDWYPRSFNVHNTGAIDFFPRLCTTRMDLNCNLACVTKMISSKDRSMNI